MTLNQIREITGLPFKQKGNRFIAACYIDGSKHKREDKVNARLVNGTMFISEEGGDSLPLKKWLHLYGDESKYIKPSYITVPPQPKRRFVDEKFWAGTFPEKYRGNLFRFLSSKFGESRVSYFFKLYSVGEDNWGNSIFWYRNESGQWLHDSVVPYLPSGKRNHKLKVNGWRKFKKADGYTGRGLFGQHLIPGYKGGVCVVESEKTALIMAMTDSKNRLWLATGGSNKTAQIRGGWKIYPDFDMAGRFWECIGCDLRGKSQCIIYREDNQRKKNWGCGYANENIVYWFDGLDLKDGDDPADWVLNNLI